MELSQAQLNNLQVLTISSGKIKTDNLVAGQQLTATVAAVNSETGEITLNINNTQVTVKTLLQLTVGQSLQLTVAQSSLNKVTLQLPQSLIDALTQQNALREALPKQQPLTDFLIQLKSLTSKTTPRIQLPEKLIQLTKNIVDNLPTPNQLSTAKGLKQAIQQSGIFLEKKLSTIIQNQPSKFINSDLKSQLLNFKSLLLTEKKTDIIASLSKNNTSVLHSTKDALKPNNAATTQLNSIPAKKLIPLETQLKTLLNHPLAKPATLALSTQKNAGTQMDQITAEQLKYKTIIDSRILEKQLNDFLSTNSRTPDGKQIFTDKQIQQILNNILPPQKIITSKSASTQLPPLPLDTLSTATTKQAAPPILKPAQQYVAKQTTNANGELPLAAIKSQNIADASISRVNNLVDLIDTLIKQVDSAISRTQLHQLNAMQDQETGKLAMSVEIPVNDDDHLHLVQLHIEKDSSQETETESMVTVNLAVDLDAIGPIYARITLIQENTNVVFWAERETTFNLVQQNVKTLQNKLEKSGLRSENIACHHGQPPQTKFIATKLDKNLLDVRA